MEEEEEAEEGVDEDKEEEEEVKPRWHGGDPSVVFERSMWTLTLSLSLSLSLLSSRADPKKNDQEKPRERVPVREGKLLLAMSISVEENRKRR